MAGIFGGTVGRRNYGVQVGADIWPSSRGSKLSGPTFSQEKTSSSGVANTNKGVTFDVIPAVGSSLILCITINAGSAVSTVVGGGVTWALARLQDNTLTAHTEIWYGHNSDGSNGVVTITLTVASRAVLDCTEWRGLKNAVPESVNSNSNVAFATVTTNSVTPISTRSLTIAVGGWSINDYQSGPINGYTRLTPLSVVLTNQEEAYLIKSSAAATSTGWTLSADIDWAACIAAFGAT